jgi:hypothetical protein
MSSHSDLTLKEARLPSHPKPSDYEEFLADQDEKHKKLHQIAEEFLGSSYFMDRTHGYQKWKKAKAQKQ